LSFTELLADYRSERRGANDALKRAYAQMDDDEAIHRAAHLQVLRTAGEGWKRHPHFHRPWFYKRDYAAALNKAEEVLILNRTSLLACRDAHNFDRLHQKVQELLLPINWLKVLACYDITELLAMHWGIEPSVVYLHAGTRTGAEALFGAAQCSGDRLDARLNCRFGDLRPAEIEDFLCIYSAELKSLRSSRRLPQWSYE
jgi:hypothetical protein